MFCLQHKQNHSQAHREFCLKSKLKTPKLPVISRDEISGVFMAREQSQWPKEVVMYTDGASRGNPGRASIGVYVTNVNDEMVFEYSEPLGVQTNNVAEYTGVIRALEMALKMGSRRVTLRSDSELMVKQMTGIYKVKAPHIAPLYQQALMLTDQFEIVRFEHVRREQNREADRLANEALDFESSNSF